MHLELKALLPLRPTDHSSRPWLRRRRDLLLPLQRSARATAHGSDTARTAWGACCRCRRRRRSRDLGSSPCLPRVASRLTGCLAVAAARRSPSRRDSFTVRGWTVFHLPSTPGYLRAVRSLRNGRDSARIHDTDVLCRGSRSLGCLAGLRRRRRGCPPIRTRRQRRAVAGLEIAGGIAVVDDR